MAPSLHPPARVWSVEEGGQWNGFVDSHEARCHVLARPQERLIFAFPAQNSGIGIWFQGELRPLADTLQGRLVPGGQQVSLTLEARTEVRLETVLLDSLRVLRERDGTLPGELDQLRRAAVSKFAAPGAWAEVRSQHASGTLIFERLQPGHGSYRLELRDQSGRQLSPYEPIPPGRLQATATLPFGPGQSLDASQLFHPDLPGLSDQLGQLDLEALQALQFLTTNEKMMAGSWRFLTYFGRDTLIAASMLEPLLSDRALTTAASSVLDRLSPEGAVAHEEDIGPFAEWHHLREGREPSLKPVYDYKMVDDDLLLPLFLHLLAERDRGEVLQVLLQDRTRRALVKRNADYALSRLATEEPIALLPSEMTGDWRDSEEGLGRGRYPGSVNAHLALPTLEALAYLYHQLGDPRSALEAEQLMEPWRAIACRYRVRLEPLELKNRLQRFQQALPPEQQAAFENLANRALGSLDGPLEFTALALDEDGEPIPIAHTDLCFSLFYGRLTAEELDGYLALLEHPWPVGLSTPVGPVVANPALSDDELHYRTLGFGTYHGLVVWSWPSAMLRLGLARQRSLHPDQSDRIADIEDALRAAEQRVGPLANSELWAVQLTPDGLTARPFGTPGDEAESNVLQLWSTVRPVFWFQSSAP